MTVLQNIRAGARRDNPQNRDAMVEDVMRSFGIQHLKDHLPSQLSGGEQQRTALARILVSSPRILLLDEPFSALDSHLRFKLEQEVHEVAKSFGKTVILVSHDRDEVYRLSDSIAIMDEGRIEAIGAKHEVFAQPATKSGAILTGCKNISPIKRMDAHTVHALDWDLPLHLPQGVADAAFVGIRMHDIRSSGAENTFVCRVVREIENPFSFTILLMPEGRQATRPIGWEMDKKAWHSIRKERLSIALPADHLLLLRDE